MIKRQWISILLCLVLVVALLPAASVHADGKVGYTVLGDSISFGFGLESRLKAAMLEANPATAM